jgi:flagellar assembly factor FliW
MTNTIQFQGTEVGFEDSDAITFDEGLIGLTHLKRMVIIPQTGAEPFMWLVPIDDDSLAFLVVPVEDAVPGSQITVPEEVLLQLGSEQDETPTLLAICRIASVWNESTVNLLSPLAISAGKMKGRQFVVGEGALGAEYPLVRE